MTNKNDRGDNDPGCFFGPTNLPLGISKVKYCNLVQCIGLLLRDPPTPPKRCLTKGAEQSSLMYQYVGLYALHKKN